MTDTSDSPLVDYEPEVVADAATAAALVAAGGRLFVWAEDAGFEHVATIAPHEPRRFDEYPGNGFTLFADSSVYPPRQWIVKRRRLRRRFTVKLELARSEDGVDPLTVGGSFLANIFDAFFTRP
jgi:hypothetical protein